MRTRTRYTTVIALLPISVVTSTANARRQPTSFWLMLVFAVSLLLYD